MTTPQRPVLLVLHQATSTAGRVGQVLKAKGYPLDIRRPAVGDDLPDSLTAHSGAIIFGGPMSANDEFDYVKREIAWIDVALKEGAPLLGICLGAQMLAKNLGARVESHPQGHAEAGYYPLYQTDNGRSMMDWPETVYQFHREGFDIPEGGDLLATGDLFPNQAFAYGDTAIGIQFHGEMTYAMISRWSVRGAERLTMPGAKPRADHINGWYRHNPAINRWLDGFLDIWLASGGEREQAA